MIGNYIKVAYRNVIKRKLYSIINTTGLALGIASFFIIALYIIDELSYDRYNTKAEKIYRICQIYDFGGVGENSASLPFPVAFTLKSDYPDMIDEVVRIFNYQSPRSLMVYEDKRFVEKGLFFADSTFFDVFDHEFVKGNPETALDKNYSVVITESMADKYFGNEDPIGKTIKFEETYSLFVTGIIKDVPGHSHFHFDFIASMTSVERVYGGRLPQTWVWNPCWTYIVLNKNVNPGQLEKMFPDFVNKYFYDAEKDNVTLYLQPLTDIHLKSRLDYEIEANSNIAYLYILGGIGIFLLIIASINFMNLSTATSSSRAKEIGMKKVVGAYRTQLICQFIGESIIMTLVALVIALIMVEITLPTFNNFTDKNIDLNILLEPTYLFSIIGLVLIIGILSGVYPSFYLSAISPISVLRGSTGKENGSAIARKVLVVLQFTISIMLIIGTVIIFKQLQFLQKTDPGFNKENIIVIPVSRTPIVGKYDVFKGELMANPSIVSVTAMDDVFGSAHNTHEFRPEGFPDNKWQFYPALVVQYDFIKTFGLEILAGRDYNEKNQTDPITGIIINEAMVKHVGWCSNEEAIGKIFRSLQGREKVIGVINDFNATSLHKSSGPFVINMKESRSSIAWFLNYVAIRITPGAHDDLHGFLEEKWNEFVENRPFEYFFLDEELKKLYKEENNLSTLSLIFTIMVLFIAALGLLGLSSYMAEKRTKEIGIRKVMGASGFRIISLLTIEFLKLIIIANIIAWPLAYFIINDWLHHFAYQTPVSWYIFLISGLATMGMALIITSVKAYTASRTNPADTLKYE